MKDSQAEREFFDYAESLRQQAEEEELQGGMDERFDIPPIEKPGRLPVDYGIGLSGRRMAWEEEGKD
jgi:hypothetical protein